MPRWRSCLPTTTLRGTARNPNSWVAGLYAEVLNRAPSQAEVMAWVNNLNAYRGDRQRLVREFLKASQQELTQRKPLPTPGTAAREGQLTVLARLLRDSLEDELGGTQLSQRLSIMSRNLVNASQTLELTPTSSPAAYAQAYQNAQMALAAVENELGSVRYSAPNSSATWTAMSGNWDRCPGRPRSRERCLPRIPHRLRFRPAVWMSGCTTTSCGPLRCCRATHSSCCICCET